MIIANSALHTSLTRSFVIGDHLLYSPDLYTESSSGIVKRNWMLIIVMTEIPSDGKQQLLYPHLWVQPLQTSFAISTKNIHY